MKNCFLSLFLIIRLISFGQSYKNYDVPLYPQIASKLCWAANIQMIAKFHGITRNQCEIRGLYYDILDPSVRDVGVSECVIYSSTSGAINNCLSSNFSLSSIWNTTMNTYTGHRDQMQEFDMVFSKLNFYSTQDEVLLPAKVVKNQIDKCRPYIMSITEGEDGDTNEHVVVVKGYKSSGNNFSGTKYLIVNDPWGERACEGKSYYLKFNYSNLSPNSDQLIKAKYFVIDIHSKNDTNCNNCRGKRLVVEDTTIPRPTDIDHSWVRFTAMKDKRDSSPMERRKPNFPIKIHYLSKKMLIESDLQKELYFRNLVLKNNIFDVVYTGSYPYHIYTYELQEKIWENIRIEYNHYPVELECTLNTPQKEKIILSFRNDKHNAVSYEYVKYMPYFQRFFRFSLNNTYYFVPKTDYRYSDGTILKSKIAYREIDVLKVLAKATKEENKYKK